VVCGIVPKFGSRISLSRELVPEFNYFQNKPIGAAPQKQCFAMEAVPNHEVFCIIVWYI
jgi:hypothetical protein